MDFELPEEMKMLQSLVRRFVKDELQPIEKQVEDDDRFPEDLRQRLKANSVKLGLWGICAPREYGGGGLGAIARVVVCEELGHVSVAVGYQGGVVGGPRVGWWGVEELKYATEEQREKYFIPIVRGEKERFGALTEPNAGSDLGNLQTRAVKDGDNYVLNGTKLFITGVDSADFGMIFAVTDPEKRARGGVTAFLVDKNTPGLSTRKLPLMGRRGLHSYELSLDNCVVPAKNILGQVGQGLNLAQAGLITTRINCSAAMVGMAQRALDMAKDYSRQRITFGQPIASRQFIQGMIIDSEVEIQASRLLLYQIASEYDRGLDVATRVFMTKPFVVETAIRTIDRAIQIHGGYGYSKELPLEMMYRDARLYSIADTSSEVARWTAARRILKD